MAMAMAMAMAKTKMGGHRRPIRTPFSGPTKNNRKKDSLLVLLAIIGVVALIIMLCFIGVIYSSLTSTTTTSTTTSSTTSSSAAASISSVVIDNNNNNNDNKNDVKNLEIDHEASMKLLQDFRQKFETRYSPEIAETMLEAGVKTFGSIDHTAERILRAATTTTTTTTTATKSGQNEFVMGFAGYSVTVGRGNFFNQSFPFVTGRLLEGIFQDIFQLTLIVRNAAIGGIPSFPYGFCLQHFLGLDVDVMSWDYGMNEGKGAAVLESYIRLSSKQLPHQPMLILLDNNANRMTLLQKYTQLGILKDSIALSKGDVVPKHILQLDDQNPNKPNGFKNWDQFGAPPKCPGRGSWHPKKMEHELIGWMLAMHFIRCLQRAVTLHQAGHIPPPLIPRTSFSGIAPLNQPPPGNPQPVTHMLYGHGPNYQLNDLSCRTSFLPALDHQKILPSVAVDGLIKPDLDIMEHRSDHLYNQGWVLDVSKVERDTKRKVMNCGGLGYQDMKIALYGIPASGPLKLWLPHEGPSHDHHNHDNNDSNNDNNNDNNNNNNNDNNNNDNNSPDASHWFDDTIILCEANEKRPDDACKLDRDLKITVGNVMPAHIEMIDGAGTYLNRKTCLHVPVPPGAKITKLGNLRKNNGDALTDADKKRLTAATATATAGGGGGQSKNNHNHNHNHDNENDDYDDNAVGLEVTLEASSTVSRQAGACCVSHIVWENH